MKTKIIILVVAVLISSCSRRVCGGLSGKRCVNLYLKNQNYHLNLKKIC